jgi:membrane protein insertase Oxa1/YidC/SpoIIIJ
VDRLDPDLSAPDPYFILPAVMTATSLLQTCAEPDAAGPDAGQDDVDHAARLLVMFFFFPAGLVLYWITNNTLSIAQQWLINKRMGVPAPRPSRPPHGTPPSHEGPRERPFLLKESAHARPHHRSHRRHRHRPRPRRGRHRAGVGPALRR